jgi:hypothetical protein
VDTNRNAKLRLAERQGRDAQQYGQQIQLRGEQEKIAQQQAQTDWLRQRPDIETTRLGQGQQRIEQGNRRLSQQDVNAERQAVLSTLKTHPTLDATRDADLIARARKAGIEVDPENYGKQSRGIWIEGVYSDPYTGSPILRDGQQIVDRTKIPVEYDGYTVTPGTAVNATAAANRQATGIAASDARAARSEARQDARTTAGEDRTAARQEEANRRAATAQLNLARSKREQAAKGNVSDEQKAQLLSDAENIEATAVTNYPDVIEQATPSVSELAGNPFAKPTYRLKARGQAAPQSTAPTGRALQRVDSSSMDGKVKSHFDNGGKAIKVRDVKTGKETLVDNYNDYLVAIGRK